jgi:hypothetical protein
METVFCNPASNLAWEVACTTALTALACGPGVLVSGPLLCLLAGGNPAGKVVDVAAGAAEEAAAAGATLLKDKMLETAKGAAEAIAKQGSYKKNFKNFLDNENFRDGGFNLDVTEPFKDAISRIMVVWFGFCKKGADQIAGAITGGAGPLCSYAINLIACKNKPTGFEKCIAPPQPPADVDYCAGYSSDCALCKTAQRPNKIPKNQHCVWKSTGFYNPKTGTNNKCEASAGINQKGIYQTGTWLAEAQKMYPNIDLIPGEDSEIVLDI